jgi:sugar lactone lactonase YvrE
MQDGGKMSDNVHSVYAAGATLGEGPLWDSAAGLLWFVDIKGQRIHRFDPAEGSARSWKAPGEVGWVLPRAAGGMIAGLQTGPHGFDPASGAFTPLVDPEPHLPGNRLNDATTDRHGRVWFGSMDNSENDTTGRLYRWDGKGCVDSGLAPVAITNGPAVTPDGRTLYHTDTLGRVIWRVPVAEDGSLGTATRFVEIEDGAGYPDGSVIDAEGCLWVALFGGWGVRRYDPAGTLMRTIRFPVANVTKIAFGGDDLRTAYATTAHKGLSDVERVAQADAGNLFAFDPGVAGLPVVPARL